MPNHVTTVIIGQKSAIKKIKELFFSTDRDGKGYLDFAKVIPVPDDLYRGDIPYSLKTVKVPATPKENEIAALIRSLHSRIGDDAEINQGIMAGILELAAEHNFDLDALGCPVKTWYDWNCDNWGTKWNSYMCKFTNKEIRFDTAWASPVPVLLEISRQLGPDVTLRIDYADEDIGHNLGSYELKGGQVVSRMDVWEGSEEAVRLACEIKRREADEYLGRRPGM